MNAFRRSRAFRARRFGRVVSARCGRPPEFIDCPPECVISTPTRVIVVSRSRAILGSCAPETQRLLPNRARFRPLTLNFTLFACPRLSVIGRTSPEQPQNGPRTLQKNPERPQSNPRTTPERSRTTQNDPRTTPERPQYAPEHYCSTPVTLSNKITRLPQLLLLTTSRTAVATAEYC